MEELNKDRLQADIQNLAGLETSNPGLVSRPLLRYISEWLGLAENDKFTPAEIAALVAALTDGIDVDFTGTQWEAEWLADNKICQCKACKIARDCIAKAPSIRG